jgi:hypothetical protein
LLTQFGRALCAEVLKMISSRFLAICWFLYFAAFPLLATAITHYQLAPDNPALMITFFFGQGVIFALYGGINTGYVLLAALAARGVGADMDSGFDVIQAVRLPRRSLSYLAKSCVYAITTLVITLTAGAAAFGAQRAVEAPDGVELGITLASATTATIKAALGATLLIVLTLGLARALCNSSASLATGVFLLLVLPLVLQLMPALNRWSAVLPSVSLERFVFSGLGVTTGVAGWHDPGTVGALSIVIGWAAVFAVAGGLRHSLTDVWRPS